MPSRRATCDGPFHHQPLRLQTVVLDFNVIVVAEQVAVPGGDFDGLFQVRLAAGQQRAAQFAGDAAAEADQPFAVGGQQFLVDPRFEVEPLQESRGGELDEVPKTRGVAGQQRQMVVGLLRTAGRFFMEAAAGGDVGLQPEDRIDPQFLGRLIEFYCPVEVAVVRQGQGVHPQGLRPLQQSADRARPVQEAVVAVAMQVGEGKGAHRGDLHVLSLAGQRFILLRRRIGGSPAFLTTRDKAVTVCHCLEQAVLGVSWQPGTACSKQWHTVVRSAG